MVRGVASLSPSQLSEPLVRRIELMSHGVKVGSICLRMAAALSLAPAAAAMP